MSSGGGPDPLDPPLIYATEYIPEYDFVFYIASKSEVNEIWYNKS
jgi:hypothetical protein